MIKVLYIVSTLKRTGPTQQLFNIIKYLDRDVFDPYLITLSPEPTESCLNDYKKLGVVCGSLGLSRLMGIVLTGRRIKGIVGEINPSIIHSQGVRADALCARLNEYPVRVTTQRNYPFKDYAMKYGVIPGYCLARYHYHLLKKIPCVIACSQSVARLNEMHSLHSDYIRNGVDISDQVITSDANKRIVMRDTLGIPATATVFVSSGSLIERKAPDILIKAFKLVSNPHAHLVVLGDGNLRMECEAIAEISTRIHFVGHVHNVCDYLAAADCFVSTSRSEGLPNSVLEALNAGLPVILSDIPSHREIINMEPRIGGLFKVDDLEQLAQQMAEFMPGEQATQAAREIINTKLNARVMSLAYQRKYIEHIERALAAGGCQA